MAVVTVPDILQCINKGKYSSSVITHDISEIIPGKIYLGTWAGSLKIPQLIQLGVKAVLCVNSERVKSETHLTEYKAADIATTYIDVEDSWRSSIWKHLEPSYNFIQANLSRGAVYVHCTAGINRSPTLVAYFLLRELYKDTRMKGADKLLDWVLQFINLKRDGINPNPSFVKELRVAELNLIDQARRATSLDESSDDDEEEDGETVEGEEPAKETSENMILHLAYYCPSY